MTQEINALPEPPLRDASPRLLTAIPGPESKQLAQRLRNAECPEVTWIADDFPVFWEKAEGSMVEDVDGNRYLDLTAAFAVASVGHTHPDVVAAITAQSSRLLHGMGDVHPTRLKVELAEALADLTDQTLGLPIFCTSGAEAVETCRKSVAIATGKSHLLAFTGGYHGLTYGSLEATARADFRAPFRHQLSGTVSHLPYPYCYRCPFGKSYPSCGLECLKHVEKTLDDPASGVTDVGGILIEPIQGRGGTVVPPPEYLPGLRKICDDRGILLVFDEIFTGFGRTGRWFAHEHWAVRPDLMAVGKALGGGLPISACIGRPELMRRWPVSQGEAIHTSTFLGHPLGCAAALATLKVMRDEDLIRRSETMGRLLKAQLQALQPRFPIIGEVRGEGLMVGIELVHDPVTREPATDISVGLMRWALGKGLILLPEGTRGNVLGIFPALNIRADQLTWAVERIEEGLTLLTA